MDAKDTSEITTEFLYAVIKGDLDKMTELKDTFFYTPYLDLDLSIKDLPNVKHKLTYELCYPAEPTDILNQYRNTIPDKILGCAALQKNVQITQFILDHLKPDVITDFDATICLYHSNIDVFKLIVENYSYTMVNKRLYVGDNSDIQTFENYKPIFNRYFTPVNILLWSFFDMSHNRDSYDKPYLYRKQQLEKLSYLVKEMGGCLNGFSNTNAPLCFQLMFQKQFRLLDMCVNNGLLIFPKNIDGYIYNAIKAYNTEMIIYLLYSKTVQHIDFKKNIIDHELLIYQHKVRRMHPLYLNALTEVIVKGHFVFYGNHYTAIRSDTVERLYNLHMAGVYIHDPFNTVCTKLGSNIIKAYVTQFIIDSNSPFSLTFLCKLFVKKLIGPKRHVQKLIKLYERHLIPLPVLYILSEQNVSRRSHVRPYPTIPDLVLIHRSGMDYTNIS